jgi:hydrogenase expression/formation protein HypD
MKFIDRYRDRDLITQIVRRIETSAAGSYTFMEVCGGHTAAIRRFGINSILPQNIKLISGPGCPVCVTGKEFIDTLAAYSEMDGVIIAAFGDLLRIPGTGGRSLEKMKAGGSDIRVVFSCLDALETARKFRDKKVIFAGIGFETTAPGTAVAVKLAMKEKLDNFLVLSAHKVMPPAMETILREGTALNGFICPGHVATITGSEVFDFIPARFNTGCVVTGFEPADILLSILMLVLQVNRGLPAVEIQYGRAVTASGNMTAKIIMNEVFEPCDAEWRGLGIIPDSGLCLRKKYACCDVKVMIPVEVNGEAEDENCICGDILKGVREPEDCSLFASECTPENPAGACMVSEEGSCNAWYKYRVADE